MVKMDVDKPQPVPKAPLTRNVAHPPVSHSQVPMELDDCFEDGDGDGLDEDGDEVIADVCVGKGEGEELWTSQVEKLLCAAEEMTKEDPERALQLFVDCLRLEEEEAGENEMFKLRCFPHARPTLTYETIYSP